MQSSGMRQLDKQVALDDVSFASTRKANEALQVFDAAINRISSARATLGAVQSRFEATIANLEISSENTAAARARKQIAGGGPDRLAPCYPLSTRES